MSSIDYLNEFLNSSLPFPFYQRLNPLFNGISNKDAPLSSGRSILARGVPLARRAPALARQKCVDRLMKEQIN